MNGEPAAQLSDSASFSECWRRLPNKDLFFPLFLAWLAFFHFLGNPTLGYVHTPSLLAWMLNAYTSKSPAADDGHGLLIPIVVLVLFWWKRKELLESKLSVWWPGVIVIAMAAGLHVVGYLAQQARIGVVALFLGIYGIMGLAWGKAFLRASFFPFFLLAFMVPIGSQTEPLTFPLRLMVTKLVAFICQHLAGIDVVSEGTSLVRSGFIDVNNPAASTSYHYDVAAPCSGMRSLIAVSAIAIIYAFLVFRAWKLRLTLLLSALPLAVLGNTVRLLVIVFVAEGWGQKAGNEAHDNAFYSMLPYIPAIMGLMLLGRWLERIQDRAASSPKSPSQSVEAAPVLK